MIDHEMLEAMRSLLQPINERLDQVDSQLNEIKETQNSMQDDIRQTRVLIETDIRHSIDLIAEQHTDIVARLDRVEKKAEGTDELRGRVSTLEHVVREHTDEIRELKKAQ